MSHASGDGNPAEVLALFPTMLYYAFIAYIVCGTLYHKNIILIYLVVQCTIMVKTTVQMSKDTKWRIVIPEIVRTVEELKPGDFIEIDIKKVEKSKTTA